MTDGMPDRASPTYRDELELTTAGGIGAPIGVGGMWQWVASAGLPIQPTAPGLPAHWSLARDVILAATPFLSDFWGVSLRTAINQVAVRAFHLKDSGDSARRLERAHDLLIDIGGPAMYGESVTKFCMDFFTTDNGAWFVAEHEGKTRSGEPAGRVVALHHLDSLRVWRTGNRTFPAVYVDLYGQYHKLHYKEVLSVADQASPRLTLFGVGRCAAGDAWRTIVTDGAMQVYAQEKLTGARALALYFVSGVSQSKLRDAQESGEENQARKGHLIYMGAHVIPVAEVPQIAQIDLAGLPDGFDPAQLQQRAALIFALALGMPFTDIATLQGGQFGTGTQSQVIDQSRSGRGVELLVRQLERKLNRLVLPKRTTIDLFGIDVRDQKAEADVKAAEGQYVAGLVGAGIIDTAQAANYLVDGGWLPGEFIAQDMTPGGALTDSGEQSKLPGPEAQDTPAAPASPLRQLLLGAATKARRPALTVDDDVIARARKLREDVREESAL